MKQFNFVLIILFFFTNCNQYVSKKKHLLNVTNETISIPVDSTVYYTTGCEQYWRNDTSNYLFYKNHGDGSIIVFDLKKKKEVKRLKYSRQGSHSISSVKGFYVESLDSIILVSGYENTLYIGNFYGQITSKIDYSRDYVGFYPIVIMSHNSQPLVIIDSLLYVLNYINVPYNSIDDLDESLARKTKVSVIVNLKNRKSWFSEMNYPEDYFENGAVDFFLSRIYNGKEFVYSFNCSHYIYVTKDHKNVQKYKAKSDLIDHFRVINPQEGYFLHHAESPIYVSILFDPFRKIYYRFSYPGIELKATDNMYNYGTDYPIASIVVLDSLFNKIDELVLPKNKFSIFSKFITEKGLYLSENTTWNPNFTEDSLKYTLVKYEKH